MRSLKTHRHIPDPGFADEGLTKIQNALRVTEELFQEAVRSGLFVLCRHGLSRYLHQNSLIVREGSGIRKA
jgi:hypothetical protein